MGLFGKKRLKIKKKKQAEADSDYTPPEVAVTEAGDDAVIVPSGAEEQEAFDEEASEDFVTKFTEFKDSAMDHVTGSCAILIAFWLSLSKVTQVALAAGAAIGAVTIVAVAAAGGKSPAFPAHINVAFVGGSYFYANDLPRFVESIGAGHITQDSVIHNSEGILQVLMTGNGMWKKWATKNAMINGVAYDYQGTTEYLYDMGACSVPQLLTGSDASLSSGNQLGTFVNDGNNPCFQQESYLEHQTEAKRTHGWDFVVISDTSKNMAFDETREEALMAFNYTYGPLLKKKKISPIIVQPHAYQSANSYGADDLASFTALIMEGAQIYKKYLNKRTGLFSHAHIAPVGNAFLAVYEESPDDLFPKLFLDDGIHPSAYGTFIYGCVIYATMTGYMPKYKRVVVDDMENSPLFASARRLQASSSQSGFPTKDEAAILFKIAKKVAIRGYKPAALKGFKPDSSFLESNVNTYQYQYEGAYVSGKEYGSSYVVNKANSYNQYNGGYNANANNYAGNYGDNNNANYQQNGNNYQDEAADGNYGGNYGNDNGGDYAGNYAGGYGNNYNDNADQNYAGNYGEGGEQYAQGNQNKMQYYYEDMSDNSN